MQFEKHRLECGSYLYYMRMPNALSVVCCLAIKVGTVDEMWPREAGLAHSLEHMLFQGTENFPDSRAITAYMEDVGGDINAFADKEQTCFIQKVPFSKFERCPLLLSEIVLKPLLPEHKIAIETNSIIEEIKQANDDPAGLSFENFLELVFAGHPLQKRIVGTREAVKSFTRQNFLNFLRKFYNGSNFTFFVAGNVETEIVLEEFNNNFSPTSVPLGMPTRREPSIPTGGLDSKTTSFRDIEQVHMAMGWQIGRGTDRETKVIEMFAVMLSGGMSFPLLQVMRGRYGMCYSVNALVYKYFDASCLGVCIGTSSEKLLKAKELILKVIEDCKNDRKLLERAKSLALGRIELEYESTAGIVFSASNDFAYSEEPKGLEEIKQEIESFTIEEIEAVVDKYLTPKRMVVSTVEPGEKETTP